MNKIINKIIFFAVVFFVLLSNVLSTFSAPPTVSVDEAVYVNLDYYGKPIQTSIVKGCSTNGNVEFKDYGSYKSVVNMSNYIEPTITEDGVQWNFGEENVDRFYFECIPEDDTPLEFPWNIDISYKLNGEPVDASKLAGASGLIEININCVPNENVQDYYKNNMLLQIVNTIDMEDTTSIEAEGAQLQSIGNYKAVLFMVLPGEEKTFTMRIGTKSFETSGIVFTMVPGTLEQLNDIKELKEAKDKVKDSTDAIYDSLDDVLTVLQEMNNGINQTSKGLEELDNSRAKLNSEKEAVYESAEKAIEDLNKMSEEINKILPHLEKSKEMIDDMNNSFNVTMNAILKTKEHINNYNENIVLLHQDINNMKNMLKSLDSKKDERVELTESITETLDKLETNLEWLTDDLKLMSKNSTELDNSIKNFHSALNPISIEISPSTSQIPIESLTPQTAAILQILNAEMTNMITSVNTTLDNVEENLDYILDKSGPLVNTLSDFLTSTSDTFARLSMVMNRGTELSKNAKESMNLLNEYGDIFDDNYKNNNKALDDVNSVLTETTKTLNTISEIINEVNAVNATFNKYKDESIQTVSDIEDITNHLTDAISSSTDFMTKLKDMLRTVGVSLNTGTEETLNGLISVLKKSLEGIETVPTLKNANDTVKKTIDDEIDKFEEENKFLYLDAQESLISFTSAENPTPESIQVILRSQEISLDDEDNEIGNLETYEDEQSVVERIINIFKKLYQAIISIF